MTSSPPPERVRRALLHMTWTRLTFLHWPYEPATVQRLLPAGLEVDTYDGRAWVGLVPFDMTVWWPGVPPLPWLSRFPETNVRTYARDAAGRTGVWFLSLDAARLPAVLAARGGWALPYFWSAMATARSGDIVTYRTRRRWPEGGPSSFARVRVGPAYGDAEVGGLDDFLTARFGLWARRAGRLWHSPAAHPPWPLRRAEVLDLRDDLVPATGLPAPAGPAVAHFSEGVRVRVGSPRAT